MLGFSSAALDVTVNQVTFNDVVLNARGASNSTQIAGFLSDTVPVRVTLTAHSELRDVQVKAWIDGFRNDVEAESRTFVLVENSTYSELLNLELPSDIRDVTKSFTLYVRVFDATDNVEYAYNVKMQREAYSLDVLSVDYPLKVSAGDSFPVSVVVENNGFESMDDGFVVVSIPSLGVVSKAYFGDLSPLECDECDNEDSVQKIVNVKLPESVAAGLYEMEIKVYNRDVVLKAVKVINVDTYVSTSVIPTARTQEIRAGETKTYDLIIVNSGNSIKVYNLQTVSGNALSVSAPSVVSVGPQSSVTVPVTVSAAKTADLGSYTFSVSVDGKQTVLNAEVVAGSVVSNSVVALTVVLAVIFVVLLVVLIVLLVRKEKPSEEVETSYY